MTGACPPSPAPPPPTTGNVGADVAALALTDRFRLFASPHIQLNTHEKMSLAGQSHKVADEFVRLIVDMCEFSGASVIDAIVTGAGTSDFGDSHIIALARDTAVGAAIIVSRDSGLLKLGPAWNGRLILSPREFVRRAM